MKRRSAERRPDSPFAIERLRTFAERFPGGPVSGNASQNVGSPELLAAAGASRRSSRFAPIADSPRRRGGVRCIGGMGRGFALDTLSAGTRNVFANGFAAHPSVFYVFEIMFRNSMNNRWLMRN